MEAINPELPRLREKTASLTESPGVYIMHNGAGEIIYIGKAKNLRRRVSSYFRLHADHLPKVAGMVSHVKDYDFIVTDSEYEALVLECSLIKMHQPHYNILLKDDKGYSYLLFSEEAYPRLTAEKNKSAKGEYLGPYMSGSVARETAVEVNKVFGLPTCNKVFPRDFKKTRPCLNYHLKNCMGVCRGNISQAAYADIIQQAKDYIRMGSEKSVERMREEMERASEALEFERAAMFRDRIRAVEHAAETQKVIDSALPEADVIAVAEHSGACCISMLRYRNRRLFDKEVYMFSDEEGTEEEILTEFLMQFYERHRTEIPRLLLLDRPIDDKEMYVQYISELAGKKVLIQIPERGTMPRYVQFAVNNANEELAIRFRRTGKEVRALEELGKTLGLSAPPAYIEAYDISNLSDTAIVCGMVVFENGRPCKSNYRRFRMKENLTQDDYACMKEALTRRLQHFVDQDEPAFSRKPDLILLDGGRGHVNTILPLIREFHLDIPVFGMVKDQKHRTRAVTNAGGELSLSATQSAFHLLTQIQDEVHRYSVAYMHSIHKKDSYTMLLTQVKGVGEKKAQKIMLHYKTKAGLLQSTPEELQRVAGVSLETARQLYAMIQEMKR